MVTLKFQHNDDCCVALYRGSYSEVTPTEDKYADGTTSIYQKAHAQYLLCSHRENPRRELLSRGWQQCS